MSEEKAKTLKPEWFKTQGGLNEIYQQTGMLFAFVGSPKEGFKVCHPWVKCRDFLHDAVRSQLTGRPCAVFGFRFDPAKNPKIDLNRMRMLVTKSLNTGELPEFRDKMAAALKLLNHFERYSKISLSTIQEVDAKGSGKSAIFLFTGSKMWVRSPFMISLYTLLIRLGDKKLDFKNARDLKSVLKTLKDKVKGDNDVNYIEILWSKLHPIMKNRKELFPTENGFHKIFFQETSINSFHDYSGILSLAKGITIDQELNKNLKVLTEGKK